jgi:CDGSH-type Zn-finger protein
MDEIKIEVRRNGPYLVHGPVKIVDADGNVHSAKSPAALCRCGASAKKPFCDGSHSRIGFQAAEKAVPESKE